MTLRGVREALDRWHERGERAALATLVEVRRSAPLPAGARFAVSASGELVGSISSGCVESDLYERLSAILEGPPESDVVTYGITDEMAAGVGLSCGGEIDVLVEPFDPDGVWTTLEALLDRRAPAVLVAGLSASLRGRRIVVTPDEIHGSLGDPDLDARGAAFARGLLARSDAAVADLVEGDAATAVFGESFVPPPRLVIVGATPIGETLCAMAARIGFEVVVIEPREAFARPERLPDAAAIESAWPDEALETLDPDAGTSVVVLTHDAKLDVPALEAALRSPCGYVGLLGGRKTQADRRRALGEAGLAESDLERIRGPVGLDIGARTAEQIAVSILAELIREGRAP